MSTRGDHRRRDRSWEREDRDRDRHGGSSRGGGRSHRDEPRRRSSRSRSPRRDRDVDRRGGTDRRDRDYRREHDRRDDRRSDRDRERERRPDDRRRDRDDDRRDGSKRDDKHARDSVGRDSIPPPAELSKGNASASSARPNLDPDTPKDFAGEPMEDTNDDDAAVMAMMGVSGFGSTKGKHVEGNQEGGVNVKKVRTWRQYMNRRGGFNRPLDKIK